MVRLANVTVKVFGPFAGKNPLNFAQGQGVAAHHRVQGLFEKDALLYGIFTGFIHPENGTVCQGPSEVHQKPEHRGVGF